jgi:hypothetical protein
MWQKRSHLLAPLAALTSKASTKWRWGAEEQEAFDGIKKVISREVMLSYPDFKKEFVIHMDASYHQLGAVISLKTGNRLPSTAVNSNLSRHGIPLRKENLNTDK